MIDFEQFDAASAISSPVSGVTFRSEPELLIGVADATDPLDVTGRFSEPMLALDEQGGGGAPFGLRYASGTIHLGEEVTDMRIDFVQPVQAAAMWFIDNDYSDLRLRAFSGDGSLLDSLIIPEVEEGGITYRGFDFGMPAISYLILDGPDEAIIDSTFIDDLSYVVPAPCGGAYVLLAGGAFAGRRARRQ